MASVKGTKTEQNLVASFAGESQARNRYTFAAKVAEKEGYPQIAAIFLETADNERVHASRMFKFLEQGAVEITATYPTGMGTTADNLRAAAEGEHEEQTELYPRFAAVAEEEGFRDVAAMYRMISNAEAHHEARFRGLLARLENQTLFTRDTKVQWKCEKCGYIHEGADAPNLCPACQHPKKYFTVMLANW